MKETSRHRLSAYIVAIMATAAALLIRWPLWPAMGNAAPGITFFPAVTIAAVYGGFWPGMFATALSALAANLMLATKPGSFNVTNVKDLAVVVLILMVGTIVSGLCEALHTARRRTFAELRRGADQAQRETEDRFRQLAENIHEVFWMSDVRGERVLYVSPGYEEICGRTCESLYDRPSSWVEVIHPDDRAGMIHNVEQRQKGIFADFEFRILRPDGSIRWARNRAFPIHDENGHVARIAGLMEDITERKQLEEEVRQAKDRLELGVRGSNLGIFEFAMPNGRIETSRQTLVNVWELLGHDPNEVPNDFLSGFGLAIHPDDRARVAQAIQTFLSSREPHFELEYRARHKNGSDVWRLARGTAIRDADGTAVRFIGSFVDINELKRIEDERERLTVQLRLLLESTDQGIHGLDLEGRCTFINRADAEMLGYSPDEVLGRDMHELIHHSHADGSHYPASECPIYRVLHEGRGCRLTEEVLWRKDGTPFAAEYSSFPIIHDGRRLGAVVTITDITERKRGERELIKTKELAEAANHAKDQFLANVSHEIRTPMNAILGMTELALASELTDNQRQLLTTVISAADSLLGMIDDLLDFAKIEAGKLELDPRDFSLRTSLGDTVRALAVRAHRKGLNLTCCVSPDVPDAVTGDDGRLRQVLLNLVGNAIKFTERGRVAVEVEAVPSEGRLGGHGDVHLRFTVRDTGMGIPPEKQAKVFLAFEQEDSSTTRKFGGTGLGLTISAQLVELMGGTIRVESEPGRGSTFSFTARFGRPVNALPTEPVQASELRGVFRGLGANGATAESVESSEDLGTTAIPQARVAPLHILVAEDNDFNVALLTQTLGQRGHRVEVVRDGREALARAADEPYDLLLLDIHMPEMDGFDVVRAIRERERNGEKHLPIVALTARSGAAERDRCLNAGMDGFLSKPVQADVLCSAVEKIATTYPRRELLDVQLLDGDSILRACGSEPSVLETISKSFRASIPKQLARIRTALHEQDASQLREGAHALAGTLAAFSTVAGTAASELEDAAARGELDSKAVRRLEAMCRDLVEQTRGLSIEQLRA